MKSLAISSLVCVLAWGSAAFGALEVEPSTLSWTLVAGHTGTQELVLSNPTDQMITVTATLRDCRVDLAGQEQELEAGVLRRSCAPWVSLPAQTWTLPPGGVDSVLVTMSVPRSASGSHWARLVFEEQVDSSATPGAGVLVHRRQTVRIFQEVPGQVGVGPQISQVVAPSAAGPRLSVRIDNEGDRILRCAGRIELRDTDGAVAAKLPLGPGRFLVYPDGSLELRSLAPDSLLPGKYTALAVLDYGGEHLVASEVEIEVAPEAP